MDVVGDKSTNNIECITAYEGFETVCLDVQVLKTAYRQVYGGADEKFLHEYVSAWE